MKKFFKVESVKQVLSLAKIFPKTKKESLNIQSALNRVLAENIHSDINIPGFTRSTMDGYAIKASSSFGSSESNPAYLKIKGEVEMGTLANFSINDGEAAKISTGGALPCGSDSVVMVEHTASIDTTSIEIFTSVAPGTNVIYKGEDLQKNHVSIFEGTKIRPQEMGLIAASGKNEIKVFKKPIVSIISTGDELVPINRKPSKGEIRDMNSYSLFGQVLKAGGIPKSLGIIPDQFESLKKTCSKALENSDMLLISGGSSLGTKDLTIEILKSLENTEIRAQGISISPGKPTILAKSNNKQIWGLPGHVTSAMVVFEIIVRFFLENIIGISNFDRLTPTTEAVLKRNISSSQGREDYIRVKLSKQGKKIFAEPIVGKSGLINTMTKADGLIRIGSNTEGLYKNTVLPVILF